MKIGLIGPCEGEILPFIEEMEQVAIEERAMLRFYNGQYKEIDIVALFSGVSKVNATIAAQILIDRYQVTEVIVVGVAGAIDPALRISDTVIATEVAHHDVDHKILTEYHPFMESQYFKADQKLVLNILLANKDDPTVTAGRMVSGEAFIADEGRERIVANHQPLTVDMETAGIAHACYVNRIPFAAIRTVSDTPEESGDEAIKRNFEEAAAKSIAVLTRYLDLISKRNRLQ